MPRPKQLIDKKELQAEVNKLEASQTFDGRMALYKALSETLWAATNKFTLQVLMTKIREYKVILKTVSNKGKGLEKFRECLSAPIERISRAEKFAQNTESMDAFDKLMKFTPRAYRSLVIEAKNGSLAAACKLNCLQCTDFQIVEIRECPIKHCSMWNFRAYKSEGVQIEKQES